MRPLPGVALLGLCLGLGCGDDAPTAAPETRTYDFDLVDDGAAWVGDFADLPADDAGFDLVFDGQRPLPDSLPLDGDAAYLAGSNLSDDLFMFLRRPLRGLPPQRTYRVDFEVQIATSVAAGLVGIGGAPGESVFVKAGASAVEPLPVPTTEAGVDMRRLNVDKGNQATGGEHAVVLGHIARDDGGDEGYDLKSLASDDEDVLRVTTAADGSLWLFVGTDSGFEGRTELYVTAVKVTLTPRR